MQVFLARKHLNDNFHIRYSEHLGKFCNPEGYVVATVSTVGTVKGDAGVALQKFPESKIIMIKIIKTNFSIVKGVALKQFLKISSLLSWSERQKINKII